MLVLVLVLIVTVLVGQRLQGLAAPAETADPAPAFSETPLVDSRWFLSRPLEVGRSGMAVSSVGLDIYAIGGETAATVVGDVNIYETRRYTWRSG